MLSLSIEITSYLEFYLNAKQQHTE